MEAMYVELPVVIITGSLSEWIIGIYLHEFTNNERKVLIAVHCWWTIAGKSR